jgi:putative oxidoreductase
MLGIPDIQEASAMEQTPQAKTYITRTMLFMGLYILINAGAIAGLMDGLPTPARWGLTALVSLPIAGQIWATLVMIRDSDEFIGAFLARQFILAAGVAMALFSAWGFAESYAGASHVPGWMIYPLFWACFALVAPFARKATK